MANSFQTVSAGSAILKNYYAGPLLELLNDEVELYKASEKVKTGWSGSQMIRSLKVSRNQGVGATTDGGNLPKIGRAGFTTATILAKYNYARVGITAGMIKASQSDVGSFVRSLGFEVKSAYSDLKKNLNRQLFWDGTATIAQVNTAAVASTSLVIKGRTSAEAALKYIDVGTTFDIYNSSTLVASNITVSAISSGTPSGATATLTLDQAVTASANYNLVLTGSYGNEIQGLYYALDGATTTAYGIDRSAVLSYQGNVSDVSTGVNPVLSIDAMQNPWNEGLRRGNIGSYSAIFTDFTSLRYYQKLLQADKRYVNQMSGDGTFGNKGKFYLEFNGLPIVPSQDSPARFAMVPFDVMKMCELAAMEVADEGNTGGMIPQSDVDSYEIRIRHFANFFNEAPNACAVLLGYTSP